MSTHATPIDRDDAQTDDLEVLFLSGADWRPLVRGGELVWVDPRNPRIRLRHEAALRVQRLRDAVETQQRERFGF